MGLRKRLRAEQRAASSSYDSLRTAAQQARTQTKTGQEALDYVIGDLRDPGRRRGGRFPTGGTGDPARPPPRARVTRQVADRIADPGPGITLTHDREGLDQLAATWRARAQETVPRPTGPH